MRLDPRAQNILDVLRWTAEGMTRKQISPGSSSTISTGANCDSLARTLSANRRKEYGALPPHKTTWTKTTLIDLRARGIRSGDAIIRDDGEGIIRKRWIYIDRAVRYPESYWGGRGIPKSRWHNPFEEGRDGTREEIIAKFEAYISDFIRLSPWALVLNHRNTPRFILRRTPTASNVCA